tara:strand:- start:100 stop:402 length:303 start_codon:yes stop_codon:yes gene_type:complete
MFRNFSSGKAIGDCGDDDEDGMTAVCMGIPVLLTGYNAISEEERHNQIALCMSLTHKDKVCGDKLWHFPLLLIVPTIGDTGIQFQIERLRRVGYLLVFSF